MRFVFRRRKARPDDGIVDTAPPGEVPPISTPEPPA
jgi:hypothetical protein